MDDGTQRQARIARWLAVLGIAIGARPGGEGGPSGPLALRRDA